METLTVYLMGLTAAAFIAAGAYLHYVRKRSEKSVPAPFLNPSTKRKPRK
jgi:hypothetical protein